jgi:hypothetical protein
VKSEFAPELLTPQDRWRKEDLRRFEYGFRFGKPLSSQRRHSVACAGLDASYIQRIGAKRNPWGYCMRRVGLKALIDHLPGDVELASLLIRKSDSDDRLDAASVVPPPGPECGRHP